MRKRRLGKTGLMVSEIGFGGIPIQRVDQATVTAILKACYDQGINFLDTARGYTTSEEMMGHALEELFGSDATGKFIIASKAMSRDYAGMKKDIETTLSLLKVKHIDLYQCHFVKDATAYEAIIAEEGALKALKEAKAEGKIGHYGVTAHGADILSRIVADGHFDTVQFPYNPIESQGEQVFAEANAKDMGVIVMKPLAGGAIQNGPLALKYNLNNPHVTVVIPGMDSVEQVLENAAIGSAEIQLSPSEQVEIDKIREAFGENFCRRCGYCMPCPQGIDIPFQFLVNGYLTRYGLEDWAVQRYQSVAVHASDCVACGACEPKCPYNLPIIAMMKETTENFRKVLEKRV